MSLDPGQVAELADRLHRAERDGRLVDLLTAEVGPFDLADAYDVQDALIDRRIADGERVIGAKLGLTSRAKQQTMGIDTPIYGWLTDAMVVDTSERIDVGEMGQPRVEPEIVLVMGEELRGPGVTPARALQAVAGVCCGLEVIDSRYKDYKFTIADVVADNASSARLTLGREFRPVDETPLDLVGCSLRHNGRVVAHAAGGAVMGHPAAALAMLANHLGARGRSLEPGWIVLTGGLTDAVPLERGGRVTARFGGKLGRVGAFAAE